MDLRYRLDRAVTAIGTWEERFGPFPKHPSLEIGDEAFGAAFASLTERLAESYPFFHPRYAGQMQKPIGEEGIGSP